MTFMSLAPSFFFGGLAVQAARRTTLLLAIRLLLYVTIVGTWVYTLSLMPDGIWARLGLTWSDFVWYIVIAEIGTFAGGPHHREVEYQLKEGHFQSHLTRPVSWLAIWGGYELADAAIGVLALILTGFSFAYMLTGYCPITLTTLPLLALMLTLAAMIWLTIGTAIGLSTLWLGSPLIPYWVAQKMLFVLGGMIIPLHLYPMWLQHIVYFTPFPAVLAIPAQLTMPAHGIGMVNGLLYQLAVLAICLIILHLIWRAFVNKLVRGG